MAEIRELFCLSQRGHFLRMLCRKRTRKRLVPGRRLLVRSEAEPIGVCNASPTSQPCKNGAGEAIEYKIFLSMLDDGQCYCHSNSRLWRWIADYLAPVGDVYKAALPGLKAEDAYKPQKCMFAWKTVFVANENYYCTRRSLARAPKQLKILASYLQLSGIADPDLN